MKFSAVTTILFTTLAIASPAPAPIAQPEAAAVVDSPNTVREAAPVPEGILTADIIEIEARAPKKGSGSKGGSSGGNNTNAAITITPSRALELAALSLGVMEVVRLWG